MDDPEALRQACEPLARWWGHYQNGEQPDPDRLARAASRARLLGPVPGPVGDALAYILTAPADDLNYPRLAAAFATVAGAAKPDPVPPTDTNFFPVQLALIDTATPPSVTRRRSPRRNQRRA